MALNREKLKKSQFGLPGKRKYPMPDAKHAANAKGRAKQQLKKGQALAERLQEDRGQGQSRAQPRRGILAWASVPE
jgi:hypothetical protein